MARGSHLGEFEEVVLLALASFEDSAYGVEIFDQIESVTGRSCSLPSVYMTLGRLEDKGYVRSHKGSPTPERGGRARRFFELLPAGAKALAHCRQEKETLWRGARLHPLLEDVP